MLRSPESQGDKGERESHSDSVLTLKWIEQKEQRPVFCVYFVSCQAPVEDEDDDGEMYEDLDERWWDDIKKIFK